MEGSEPADEQVRAAVDAVYRTESRRVLATLIRLLGDFDRAEEAMHDRVHGGRRAVAAWRRARQPSRVAGVHRPLQVDRHHAQTRAVRRVARRAGRTSRGRGSRYGRARRGERRRRSPAPHLHVLPSGADPRRADRADTARGLRPHHRGDRARLFHRPIHRRPAHRPCQGQDSRREHSVSGAGARRSRPIASTPCCTWSIWCSTRATSLRRATR